MAYRLTSVAKLFMRVACGLFVVLCMFILQQGLTDLFSPSLSSYWGSALQLSSIETVLDHQEKEVHNRVRGKLITVHNPTSDIIHISKKKISWLFQVNVFMFGLHEFLSWGLISRLSGIRLVISLIQ